MVSVQLPQDFTCCYTFVVNQKLFSKHVEQPEKSKKLYALKCIS